MDHQRPLIPVNLQRFGPEPSPDPAPSPPPAPAPVAFDWKTVPENELKSHEARIKQEQYSHTKGRVIGEMGVQTEDELKELVELGRRAKAIPPKDPKKSDEITPETKQAIEEAQLAKQKLAETHSTFASQIMKTGLMAEYITQGGIPNSADSTVADQAISLMMQEKLVKVNDKFELVAESGITVPQMMEMWLKRNPHFKTAVQPVKAPGAPATQTPAIGGAGQKPNAMAAVGTWLES